MHFDDTQRLAALKDYRVLDSPEEASFDNLTAIAARRFDTSISLVSLVDERRQWFKSRVGLAPRETSREVSFCDHAVRSGQRVFVPDARLDERFKDNPLVTGDPHIRFYCGIPLRTPEGHCLGTFCVIDSEPRQFSQGEFADLEALARQVELELELRRRSELLGEAMKRQQHEQQSKELLAAMLVHDLRSPLSSVMLLASCVRPVDAESSESLAELLGEAERMGGMLSDVLDVCLSEAGVLRVRRTEFSLRSLGERIIRRMAPPGRSGARTLTAEFDQGDMVVEADPQLLTRVLENLLSNAMHHGHKNSAIILRLSVSPGGRVQGEVRDQGPVIPPALRQSVFRIFEQLATQEASEHRGHGLGLTFCRLAIEAHGGEIDVSPNAEVGNCFHFEFPAHQRTA